MHDRYKKRFRVNQTNGRLRRQIATEAAKRLLSTLEPEVEPETLCNLDADHFSTAKRMAVTVLGAQVRPTDLPSDHEVREQAIVLLRAQAGFARLAHLASVCDSPKVARLADHLDRFAIFRMRLIPLEDVKLNPRFHPEGDALFHSLQVFEQARLRRPFDEEFLLAALLHEVGRAIDPDNHVAAGIEALAGTLEERTVWLIEHLPDALPKVDVSQAQKARAGLRGAPWRSDLLELAEADLAGRMAGAPVPSLDEALDYLRTVSDQTAPAGVD